MLFGLLSWYVPSVALVNKGEFDRLTGDLLYYTRKFAHLRTILLIGRGQKPRQQVAQRINYRMHEARLCAVWLHHSRYGCH